MLPRTLVEAIRYFSDPEVAHGFMVKLRWPNGVECPHCGSSEIRYISTRRLWECKTRHPRRQFSYKVGTIFEDSPLGLDVWLPAIWMIANCKNGVSSHEMARSLGVTLKTAWFMLHRIRLAMQPGSSASSPARSRRMKPSSAGGLATCTPASGRPRGAARSERKSCSASWSARARSAPSTSRTTSGAPSLRRSRGPVEPGSDVYTDDLASNVGLAPEYVHDVIDHPERYVDGRIHTNGLEKNWRFRTCEGSQPGRA